ncbi:uncharacterized protein BT62DRAFT_597588 [Guyanagaster necrorhizus]|uniref:Uncharacterized protein n=1 Tax=Guyanagaster necrorhizus TaxID=856835 RepID=A0A9P8AVZ8_9AGAR|nr:uncharacterized protein BT62DRAFT_597588 [Guyanagaster necrorhizus MCA 3950]KAG7449631.1 hypothetical protein BT62DRAFT_597588 [Guyanagaster necrorhizus MCA 3950]
MASYRTCSPAPADIITYRFRTNLVYVKPELDYEVALDVAQKEFAQLVEVDRHRIVFTTQATVAGIRTSVRISASAWASTVSRMLRGEVIDVEIAEAKKEDEPPQYLEVPEAKEDYARCYRSAPSSRSNSRTRQSSPTPSLNSGEKSRRTWFTRHF